MTWLVKVALDRPYTFIVLALMILIFGPLAAIRTPTDIFPEIGIPVLGVAFSYAGLSPEEMGARVMANYERLLSTTVNDVEHVESLSIPGLGIAKIYFQPDVDIRLATAEVTAISQSAIRQMPANRCVCTFPKQWQRPASSSSACTSTSRQHRSNSGRATISGNSAYF